MNRLIVSFAALLMIYSSANAQAVKLRGETADAFVAKYFGGTALPPALIKRKTGYMSKKWCSVRQSRSPSGIIPATLVDGGQSLCKVIY